MTILDPSVSSSKALLRDRFACAKPFKHAIIDGFFTDAFARELLEQFPKPDEKISVNLYGAPGRKAMHPDLSKLGSAYRKAHAYFGSSEFLTWLSELTGIQGLLYDERNFGGGTHENFEGRDLRPHVDFNYHPISKLHRRLNLIVYFNEGWQPEWGGAIALHSDPRSRHDEVTEYQPSFNRCIIFETNEHSWHGFERLTFPPDQKDRSRKSLSIYLYTRERPESEAHAEHTTFFIPRSLPSHFSVDHALTASDLGELKELLGQRDRLIELYQREQGKHEADSAQAARLRILVAESQANRSLPAMGYVRQCGEISGWYADGWSSSEMRFSMRAERPVRLIAIRVRIPDQAPSGTELYLDVNGVRYAETLVSPGIVTLSAGVRIETGNIGVIQIATSSVVNPKRCGLSEDERDLGFFLECVTFEHERDISRALAPLKTRAQPQTYFAIGDCHTACLDGMLFDSSENPDDLILVKSSWQLYARAYDVCKDGYINKTLARKLLEMRLLLQISTEWKSPFAPVLEYTTPERAELKYFALRPGIKDSILLFSYGEVDAWDIAHEYSKRYYFDVPGILGLENLPDDEDAREELSLEAVQRHIAARCKPLFEGLVALHGFGFSNIFLHGLPPPSPRRHKNWSSARLRYKLNTLFNRLYADFCSKNGIGFVSIWDDISIDGIRDPHYDRDSVHLTSSSAIFSINRLRQQLKARAHSPVHMEVQSVN